MQKSEKMNEERLDMKGRIRGGVAGKKTRWRCRVVSKGEKNDQGM